MEPVCLNRRRAQEPLGGLRAVRAALARARRARPYARGPPKRGEGLRSHLAVLRPDPPPARDKEPVVGVPRQQRAHMPAAAGERGAVKRPRLEGGVVERRRDVLEGRVEDVAKILRRPAVVLEKIVAADRDPGVRVLAIECGRRRARRAAAAFSFLPLARRGPGDAAVRELDHRRAVIHEGHRCHARPSV